VRSQGGGTHENLERTKNQHGLAVKRGGKKEEKKKKVQVGNREKRKNILKKKKKGKKNPNPREKRKERCIEETVNPRTSKREHGFASSGQLKNLEETKTKDHMLQKRERARSIRDKTKRRTGREKQLHVRRGGEITKNSTLPNGKVNSPKRVLF